MNVVGHNIANVNTIGFKSQRMDFQDLFYNNTFSSAGLEQIGMGARVGTVLTDFSQGSFEQTGLSTDLAIQGKGWFQVRVPSQETVYYTRAGDFSFNKEGELVNPQGYILQGWQVPLDKGPSIGIGASPQNVSTSPIIGSGVPKDIKLETWTVLPKETSKITTYVNLAAATTDNAHWELNPFAALFNTWDGQLVDPVTNLPIQRDGRPYIAEDAFGYQSSIKIYDEAGVAHTATIYFDKVEKDFNASGTVYYDGGKPSETIWEYIVTIDPAEDARMVWDSVQGKEVSIQTMPMAGVLMSGTLTFGGNGDIVDMSAYTLNGGLEAAVINTANGNATVQARYHAVYTDPVTGLKTNYSAGNVVPAAQLPYTGFYPDVDTSTRDTQHELFSWLPTAVSNNGLPLTVANFTARDQAMTVGSPQGKEHLIEIDFGIKCPNLTTPWTSTANLGEPRTATGGGPFAPVTPPDPTDPTTWATAGNLAGISGTPVLAADHSRLVGSDSSATMLSQQDGYTFGNLMDITFDQHGIMSGIYSNGVTLPLYQVVLYDFVAPQALRFEGGNLVSQTRDSGDPSWGAAGVNGFGTINSYMIEQSNVDLAKEMVNMITTQRGFQANSKVITTTDIMLETVVNMKR
jgi:flagellar hook protein FlgE